MQCLSEPLSKEFPRDLDEHVKFGHKPQPTAMRGSDLLAIRIR
jgi:hypothetical protein